MKLHFAFAALLIFAGLVTLIAIGANVGEIPRDANDSGTLRDQP